MRCVRSGMELMNAQSSFSWSWEEIAPKRAFDGRTYEPDRDYERLKGQLERVFNVMHDGHWRTLASIHAEILKKTGKSDSEAAISARLRDFRKAKFGSHEVERQHIDSGLFTYRLRLSERIR